MYGKGMETTLSLNWIVLLHLTSSSAPHEQNWIELSVNWESGLNLAAEVGKRCDFLNRPKKATKQTAQKEASKLMLQFNNP